MADSTETRLSLVEQSVQRIDAALADIRAEMRVGFTDIRAEMRADRDRAQRQFYALLVIYLGGMGAIIGGGGFLLIRIAIKVGGL